MIEGRDAVFVRTPDGFQVRNVTVGQRLGGQAEIVSGLTAADRVAVRNAFLLKAELNKGAEEEE
jgi:cobalt-zinc-cadmium efflux system membrane fusion protein